MSEQSTLEKPIEATASPAAAPAESLAESEARREKMRRRAERSTRRTARRTTWTDFALRIGFLFLLLGLWQGTHWWVVERPGDVSRGALFSSPAQVGRALADGFGLTWLVKDSKGERLYTPPPGEKMPATLGAALKQARYPSSIGTSIWRLLQGYFIATLIGFPLGLLVARSSLAEKTVGWLAVSLQSLPSICWIPLALLWFGRAGDLAPILFVTIMGSLFATVVTVADGLRNVPPLFARAGRTLGASGPRLYFSVLLPAALPGIVSGLKVGWGFAWRSLMAAELIVNIGGLGFLLQRDREFGETEGVLATILVIIVIGIAVQDLLFKPIERRLQNLWGLTGAR
jgi:NitT/TauT family transport system permease protein